MVSVLLLAIVPSSGVLIPPPPPPSGIPIPGDAENWNVTFADDFNGTELDPARWTLYDGWSKSQPPSLWRPSQVRVADGVLSITGEQVDGTWLTGGLSSAVAGSQLYGRWDIRFRIDPGDGDSYAILLYPKGGGWPPEIDIAEDAGGDRRSTTATLHYGSDNKQIHSSVSADFSTWQTIGVVWSPGKLSYTLNGKVFGTVSGRPVPKVPMWLGLQVGKKSCDAEQGNCPLQDRFSPVTLQVDWIVRYQRK
jgi:beta-glucanase (GH16 family)